MYIVPIQKKKWAAWINKNLENCEINQACYGWFFISVAVTRDGWTEMVNYYVSDFEKKSRIS